MIIEIHEGSERVNDVWSALSDGTRREILTMLRDRDMTAGEIADRFELSKATVSHHLSILKQAGLITGEKKAQTITYRLNTTVFQDFMRSVATLFHREGE